MPERFTTAKWEWRRMWLGALVAAVAALPFVAWSLRDPVSFHEACREDGPIEWATAAGFFAAAAGFAAGSRRTTGAGPSRVLLVVGALAALVFCGEELSWGQRLLGFETPSALNYGGGRLPTCVRCFTCDGFPCRIGAKNDVTQTALRHADPDHLTVLARTVAARLVQRDGRATELEAIAADGGAKVALRARAFVVSAGAIGTPALLLRSGFDRHDRSGSIGRYLMRHCNGMVGYLFPFRTNPERVNHKQICVSDLYESRRAEDGTAVGVIQDMCMPPPEVVHALGPAGFRWAASLSAGFIQTLICIAEDEPQAGNRVSLTETTDRWGLPVAAVDHHYTPADLRRRGLLIRAARRILRRAGGIAGKVKMIESFSHAVGSVRMGADAASAALDSDCRLWAFPNLFVVDGSFMPTSGGVNPSLTITANALRVAERLKLKLRAL